MPPRSFRKLIVAIDGPAGSGKSSTAKALAKRLRIPYIDTGAMYRAVTLKAMREGVPFTDTKKLIALSRRARIRLEGKDPARQKVFLDGREVTKAIRHPELTKNVFYAAQEPRIRRILVAKQRLMGKKGGGVMEGRDIGTVVFPDADYKFYFEASTAIRAKRRWRELVDAGQRTSLTQVLKDQKKRDLTDYRRKEGPLRPAKDAIRMDTTPLTISQTVDRILQVMRFGSSAGVVNRYSKARKPVRSVH
ncbi:MAG: (d)CMP kinase [Candidatus Omnitrophota bacterium]